MSEARRLIDADALLEAAKAAQKRLYAEDYDEILSYEDLVRMVEGMVKDEQDS